MSDILLDRNTHDLALTGYDLELVYGTDLIRQRIKQRVLTILGEWFLDVGIGVPWFDEILRKAPDRNQVEAAMIQAIAETEGVTELTELELDFDPATRKLTVAFRVDVGADEIALELTL